MKIGIFDPYLDDLGGGEKYMISLAECLSSEHEVTVFWDKKEDLSKVSKRFSLNISKITVRPNVFSSNFTFFRRCLESLKYDVIIALSDGSIPFVCSKRLFLHFQQPMPKARLLLKDNLKKMRVTTFFCNSGFTKHYIDKEFIVNSKIIYPPVDIDITKAKKENIILHVGRFRAINLKEGDYKKQEVMLNAFKQMIGEGLRGWKFILAAGLREKDKARFDRLKKSADKYPVEFLTNLSKDELNKIYAKAKIYWHASGYGEDLMRDPQMAEHFGISTVEAMTAGAVPIVFNAGGQKEIVENKKNGYLWDTLKELMEKTEELIKNEKLLIKMSEKAIEKAGNFSRERFCDSIKRLIER